MLLLLWLLLCASPALAVKVVTLDAMAWDADAVVHGAVLPDAEGMLVVAVAEVLSGEGIPPRLVLVHQEAVAPGHELLLFLHRTPTGWQLRSTAFGLVDLDTIDVETWKYTVTADARVLREPEAVLAHVRGVLDGPLPPQRTERTSSLRKLARRQAGVLSLRVPPKAEASALSFWEGDDYTDIITPPYAYLRGFAMELVESKQQYEREQGARMLANYPGPESIDALMGLLADPAHSATVIRRDVYIREHWPVRQAAVDSLRELGVSVEAETRREPPYTLLEPITAGVVTEDTFLLELDLVGRGAEQVSQRVRFAYTVTEAGLVAPTESILVDALRLWLTAHVEEGAVVIRASCAGSDWLSLSYPVVVSGARYTAQKQSRGLVFYGFGPFERVDIGYRNNTREGYVSNKTISPLSRMDPQPLACSAP